MPSKGRGRGFSSSRGRGQHSSLHRIQKSSSPAANPPGILLTTPDGHVALRSPVRTRGVTSKMKKQAEAAPGNPKQSPEEGGPSSSSSKTGITIPTTNSFEMLSDNEEDGKSVTQQDNDPADAAKKAKLESCALPRARDRLPLIHVVATLPSIVDDLLLPSNVEYFTKVTKVAVQVLAVDKESFDKILVIFKTNNLKYFTYDTRDSKRVKIVLQGLEEKSIPEVKDVLEDLDITPREVKVLSKKTTATGTHVLYLLYFDKGSVKIQDLRQVKTLCGNIVNWRFFTKKPTDAAQCHRCQKFGHGSRNCNLPPRCVKCGENHLTESCPLPRKATLKETGNADQHKSSVKCANCGGNHTANFRGCKSRKSFIEQQEKKKPPASSSAKPGAGRSSGHPPGWSRSWADVAAGREPAPAQDDAADGDLFTMSEFLILARDMYATLSSCRSKVAQFMALSKLMQQYLCAV